MIGMEALSRGPRGSEFESGETLFSLAERTELLVPLERVGGQFNASTSFDRTNYFATIGRESLEGYIAIEADRMRSLAVNADNFENQRAVVKEEYRMRYENAP